MDPAVQHAGSAASDPDRQGHAQEVFARISPALSCARPRSASGDLSDVGSRLTRSPSRPLVGATVEELQAELARRNDSSSCDDDEVDVENRRFSLPRSHISFNANAGDRGSLSHDTLRRRVTARRVEDNRAVRSLDSYSNFDDSLTSHQPADAELRPAVAPLSPLPPSPSGKRKRVDIQWNGLLNADVLWSSGVNASDSSRGAGGASSSGIARQRSPVSSPDRSPVRSPERFGLVQRTLAEDPPDLQLPPAGLGVDEWPTLAPDTAGSPETQEVESPGPSGPTSIGL